MPIGVLDALPDYVAPGGRDLVVRTTLSPRLQGWAEEAVRVGLKTGKKKNVGDGAMVVLASDGAVLALVGGGDYGKSQFNRVTQARRQPGSAFKPMVYLTALEKGLRPESLFVDRPIAIGEWRPKNFNGKFEGEVTLETALVRSINTVAVEALRRSGARHVVATARRLGVSSPLPADAGLALGTGEVTLLELTAAYGVLAAGGYRVWPHAIREISDGTGKILYRRQGSDPARVVQAGHVADMTRMMQRVVRDGTGRRADIGRPAAGKTGTSQDHRDAWFVGYTPQLIAGVWFGNDNAAPMKEVTGGGLPALTWSQFMERAHRGRALKAFKDGGEVDMPSIDAVESSFWQRLARVIEVEPGEEDTGRSGD